MDDFFECDELAEAEEIAAKEWAGVPAPQIIETIQQKLQAKECTEESICALMETLRGQKADLQPLAAVLTDMGGAVSGYSAVCLVLAAQLSSEAAKARTLLSKVNPLVLEGMPGAYSAWYYIGRAEITSASEAAERKRFLGKANEAYERDQSKVAEAEKVRLELALRHVQIRVLEDDGKAEEALAVALEVLQQHDRLPAFYEAAPAFAQALEQVVLSILEMPFCAAKMDVMAGFSRLIGSPTAPFALWAAKRIQPQVLKWLVGQFTRGEIVPLDRADVSTYLQTQYADQSQRSKVVRNLVELDVVSVSRRFANVRIQTLQELLGLPGSDEPLDVLIELVLERKIEASVDEVASVVYFGDGESALGWNHRAADVFSTINDVVETLRGQ